MPVLPSPLIWFYQSLSQNSVAVMLIHATWSASAHMSGICICMAWLNDHHCDSWLHAHRHTRKQTDPEDAHSGVVHMLYRKTVHEQAVFEKVVSPCTCVQRGKLFKTWISTSHLQKKNLIHEPLSSSSLPSYFTSIWLVVDPTFVPRCVLRVFRGTHSAVRLVQYIYFRQNILWNCTSEHF